MKALWREIDRECVTRRKANRSHSRAIRAITTTNEPTTSNRPWLAASPMIISRTLRRIQTSFRIHQAFRPYTGTSSCASISLTMLSAVRSRRRA